MFIDVTQIKLNFFREHMTYTNNLEEYNNFHITKVNIAKLKANK